MRISGLLLAWTLIEIGLFVTVGGRIGLMASLAIIFGTAIAGAALLRFQSRRMAIDLQSAMRRVSSPLSPMAHQIMIAFAAFLLILPGFMGDLLGLLLFVPPVRSALIVLITRRMPPVERPADRDEFSDGKDGGGVVIDAEFIEVETPPSENRRASGWTRH